jgi:hypothetical protein
MEVAKTVTTNVLNVMELLMLALNVLMITIEAWNLKIQLVNVLQDIMMMDQVLFVMLV